MITNRSPGLRRGGRAETSGSRCRANVLLAGLAASAGLALAAASAAGRVEPLANGYVTVYESPDPAAVFAYSPGLARLDSGRLIATMDQGGPGVAKLPGIRRDGQLWRGRIYSSDDHGATWMLRAETPMLHARPFAAGKAVYVLGHAGDLTIMRSDDGGTTWGAPARLTAKQRWHQAPCNVWYARDRIYLVMERNTDPSFKGWAVSVLAPVVLSARVTDDLCRPDSWTFSSELSFRQAVEKAGTPRLIGAPFFPPGPTVPLLTAVANVNPDRRTMAPIGWLETNIVQFLDPDHLWCDPSGHTFHLLLRAHTGAANLACLAKAVEDPATGQITVDLEKAPSGEPMLYVPMPGGHLKFHILYDDVTRRFWLLSSQATDSMTRPERLPPERYNLPNNERQRLVLHFSKNAVDWCFAGQVTDSGAPRQARHYASMVIDGDDLHVLSRSGDARALTAHDGNLITFHTVRGFRALAY